MNMDKIYEELGEARAEIAKLKSEYQIKAELSKNLKRSHTEQLVRLQEANSKFDKLGRELNGKAEELSLSKQQCDDLRFSLNEKESIIQHLSAANDKLRINGEKKCRNLEEENRKLMFALDEKNENSLEQEQKIWLYKGEIEGLKKSLSVFQKKCSDAEEKSKAMKEMRERENIFFRLEEKNEKFKDELKWKKEQFKHLEEALEKLRDRFKVEKKQWEDEKSGFLDEISSLQGRLHSQERISKDVQNRLEICNQALAHEESRRKIIQAQVSEFQERFESAFAECEDVKVRLEDMTARRDKEIACLRLSLGTKESFNKEMQYQREKLEQENKELKVALKELREAQIQGAGASSSLGKLRNKLKSLEAVHRESMTSFRVKESEWSLKMGQINEALEDCRSELEMKEARLKELKADLEGREMENEELSVMLLVLKMGISETELKLGKEKDEMEANFAPLRKKMEIQDAALVVKSQKELIEELEKVESLNRKIESLDRANAELAEKSCMERGAEEVSLGDRNQLKEQVGTLGNALERANIELTEKIFEVNEAEFELQIWKSMVDRLKADLEENYETRKELEASLLAQVDFGETIEKEGLIVQIKLLQQEKESILQTMREKDESLENLEKEVDLLEQESCRRELETKAKELEMDKQIGQMKMDMTCLEKERSDFIEDVMKLSSEREMLLDFIGQTGDKICEFSSSDKGLVSSLERLMSSLNNDVREMNLKCDEENFSPKSTMKKLEGLPGLRSPFRQLNS